MAVGAPARAHRTAIVLLVVELAQGVVGFVQYFTDLPIVLVGLHLLGAALTSAALTWLLVSVRQRVAAEPDSAPSSEEDATGHHRRPRGPMTARPPS